MFTINQFIFPSISASNATVSELVKRYENRPYRKEFLVFNLTVGVKTDFGVEPDLDINMETALKRDDVQTNEPLGAAMLKGDI